MERKAKRFLCCSKSSEVVLLGFGSRLVELGFRGGFLDEMSYKLHLSSMEGCMERAVFSSRRDEEKEIEGWENWAYIGLVSSWVMGDQFDQ